MKGDEKNKKNLLSYLDEVDEISGTFIAIALGIVFAYLFSIFK